MRVQAALNQMNIHVIPKSRKYIEENLKIGERVLKNDIEVQNIANNIKEIIQKSIGLKHKMRESVVAEVQKNVGDDIGRLANKVVDQESSYFLWDKPDFWPQSEAAMVSDIFQKKAATLKTEVQNHKQTIEDIKSQIVGLNKSVEKRVEELKATLGDTENVVPGNLVDGSLGGSYFSITVRKFPTPLFLETSTQKCLCPTSRDLSLELGVQ